jgi:hypothetical protein
MYWVYTFTIITNMVDGEIRRYLIVIIFVNESMREGFLSVDPHNTISVRTYECCPFPTTIISYTNIV